MKEYMENILIGYFEQQLFYQEAIKNLLSLLVIELVRKRLAEKMEFYQLSAGIFPINEIFGDIKAHCAGMSMGLLAEKYGYNESYMSRMIHKITGESFLQLLMAGRYQKAVRLLKESDLPVELIALESGYNNVNNLYRLLKRETGKSPMEIRLSIR